MSNNPLLENNNRADRMKAKLSLILALSYLHIENESQQHADHYLGDGQTHFSMLVVSPEFQGLTRLQRHQKVNQALLDEFQMGLHALSLQVFSPEEWAQKTTHPV